MVWRKSIPRNNTQLHSIEKLIVVFKIFGVKIMVLLLYMLYSFLTKGKSEIDEFNTTSSSSWSFNSNAMVWRRQPKIFTSLLQIWQKTLKRLLLMAFPVEKHYIKRQLRLCCLKLRIFRVISLSTQT